MEFVAARTHTHTYTHTLNWIGLWLFFQPYYLGNYIQYVASKRQKKENVHTFSGHVTTIVISSSMLPRAGVEYGCTCLSLGPETGSTAPLQCCRSLKQKACTRGQDYRKWEGCVLPHQPVILLQECRDMSDNATSALQTEQWLSPS